MNASLSSQRKQKLIDRRAWLLHGSEQSGPWSPARLGTHRRPRGPRGRRLFPHAPPPPPRALRACGTRGGPSALAGRASRSNGRRSQPRCASGEASDAVGSVVRARPEAVEPAEPSPSEPGQAEPLWRLGRAHGSAWVQAELGRAVRPRLVCCVSYQVSKGFLLLIGEFLLLS